MRITTRITFCLLMIVVGSALAAKSKQSLTPRIPLHIDLTWSTSYDDNLFRMSERDLNRFESGTETYDNPNSTWDDWRNDLGVNIQLPWKHSNGWETQVEGSAKAAIHATNHRKDYYRYAVSLRETFSKVFWVEASFALVPKYYLREYLDRDLDFRTNCDYESRSFNAKLRYRSPWKTYLYPFYEFKSLYYNRYFTEFDAEWTTIGINAQQFLNRRWLVGGSYRFTMSDNVGGGGLTAASQVNPMEDSEYGDGDFDEDEFRGSITYRPRRLFGKRGWEFSISSKLRIRNYTTDNSINDDPFHVGRRDTRWEVNPEVSTQLLRNLSITVDYLYEERDTDTNISYVREFKEFTRRVYSISLKYQLLPLQKTRKK